ncbi:hypothetical protein STCU_06029 [Strigomonas culicis]|nr:hypothetical protein STCU_06029 [Strigomonas culicis]|eukprot:EPY26886.1 hypothetical protein STCU_06029 [Strigomonas culicis]
MLTFGKDSTYKGSMADDKTWEEEVKETKPPKAPKVLSPEATKKRAAEKKKKLRQQKKLGKRAGLREAKRSLLHRRHPQRAEAEKEVAELDEILAEHEETQAQRELRMEKRHEQRKAKMDVKHFGRYYYEALAPDVATSDKLVGSLRHMRGGAIHPALDRMKSLEERNLVPARPRHEFNKRKVLKPKGEVRVKRETFGTLPETSF